jgi:chromosome segregation ATPase
MQKVGVEAQNQVLRGQVDASETKGRELSQQVKKLSDEAETLRKDIDLRMKDIEAANRKYEDARRDVTRSADELVKIKSDRDDIDSRMKTLRRERDDLMGQIEKIKNKPPEEKVVEKVVEKIVYRDRPSDSVVNPVDTNSPSVAASADVSQTNVVVQNNANETYWAGIMRQKASLEMELVDVKRKLTEKDLKIEELKKAGSDYQMEVGRLKNERDEIIRKIKYGDDLADSLSIELARARNDSKAIADRADKVSLENQGLRGEIKQLTSTKMALEKSIARLTDDKAAVEKKLVETENIIQGRIDEIWKIKKDVDTRFDANRNNASEVELAPIVVNANATPSSMTAAPSAPATPSAAVRRAGNIVSVNEENNFVVINLGESDNVHNGDVFKVYRDKNQIGSVAVIQVRKDISAADIKQKTAAFKAGDLVK